MIEIGISQVYQQIEAALEAGDLQRAENLCLPALDQFYQDPQLHFYASILYSKRGLNQVSRLCVERSIDLLPSGPAYSNLGAVLRRLNDHEGSVEALLKSIGYSPDDANAWNNLAANYVNEGNPGPGIEAARRAMALRPDLRKAQWNLGLLLLEAGQFAEGFDHYRCGLVESQRMLRSYTKDGAGEPILLESLHQLQQWREENGRKPRVIVWGEQGLGDEIMFSTIIPDLANDAEVIFECHPRLEGMMRRTYGSIVSEFHPTRKDTYLEWPAEMEPAQFKCAIGDLGAFYRRDLHSFKTATKFRRGNGYLMKPDPELASLYRETLEQMFPGKRFIGVAWTGGVIHTMRWYRSCQLTELYDLGKPDDVVLVSLQYEDDADAIVRYVQKTGRTMLRFPAITQHYDYDHTLALVAAMDEVVTVCQTVAHLAGAAGQDVSVLVPDKPAWRYGLNATSWYWYWGHGVTLWRRDGADWGPTIEKLCFSMEISPLPPHEQRCFEKVELDVPITGPTMLELGSKQFGKYKRWFEFLGWSHTSVDLNGEGGALPLDLQEPLYLGAFDVVTNFGTSEHVANQEPCWRNIHDSVCLDGFLISTTPLPGDWPEHGRWYPTLEFYQEFARRNGYEILHTSVDCEAPRRMLSVVMQRRAARVFVYPGDHLIWQNVNEKAKVGAYI